MDVGTGVGLGENVGSTEGWDVGTDVGSDVGSDVGTGIGTDVGTGIGTVVGAHVYVSGSVSQQGVPNELPVVTCHLVTPLERACTCVGTSSQSSFK